MWTDLSQEEKYDLIRDYVRRGFHTLDSIMEDYDNSLTESNPELTIPTSGTKPVQSTPVDDVIDEYFRRGT